MSTVIGSFHILAASIEYCRRLSNGLFARVLASDFLVQRLNVMARWLPKPTFKYYKNEYHQLHKHLIIEIIKNLITTKSFWRVKLKTARHKVRKGAPYPWGFAGLARPCLLFGRWANGAKPAQRSDCNYSRLLSINTKTTCTSTPWIKNGHSTLLQSPSTPTPSTTIVLNQLLPPITPLLHQLLHPHTFYAQLALTKSVSALYLSWCPV